jgi:hypothetical protein
MITSTIRYSTFPRTQPPPDFVPTIADIFRKHEDQIGTKHLKKGLTSNDVLTILRDE